MFMVIVVVLILVNIFVIFGVDLCVLFKVCKNVVEIVGVEVVYLCDGVVVVNFFVWFDENVIKGIMEIDVVIEFEVWCSVINMLWDVSFDIIVGVGSNGVVIYYWVIYEINCMFKSGELLVLDSGG